MCLGLLRDHIPLNWDQRCLERPTIWSDMSRVQSEICHRTRDFVLCNWTISFWVTFHSGNCVTLSVTGVSHPQIMSSSIVFPFFRRSHSISLHICKPRSLPPFLPSFSWTVLTCSQTAENSTFVDIFNPKTITPKNYLSSNANRFKINGIWQDLCIKGFLPLFQMIGVLSTVH